MARSTRVRDADLRAMLRLAGEAGELPADSDARRRHLLDGVCRLVGGVGGMLFVKGGDPGRGPLLGDGPFVSAGLSAAQDTAFAQLVRTDLSQPFNPIVPLVLRPDDPPLLTRHRRQVADEATWYRSPFFEQFQRPLGLDHVLYPKLPLPGGRLLLLAVFRPLGDRPFEDRDCQRVDTFHADAGRLYGAVSGPPRVPSADLPAPPAADAIPAGLPPRLRPVLQHLLGGDGEKQVAMKLGLSRHTVHEYVKVLYRTVGVSSRGELMAKCLGGGRGRGTVLTEA